MLGQGLKSIQFTRTPPRGIQLTKHISPEWVVCLADKLASYTGSNTIEGDGSQDAAAAAKPAAALDEEWTTCVEGLKESYVLANKNFKYLGTIQEFLVVSGGEIQVVCRFPFSEVDYESFYTVVQRSISSINEILRIISIK